MVARVVNAISRLAPHGAIDRCPGGIHAIAADDGALVRVRVPGGYLTADALEALAEIAERFGDGSLDITARANVQLRGLREPELDTVARALEDAGLLPSSTHDRIRNIVANPFAGADPHEAIDVRAIVRDLDTMLRSSPALVDLSPKFLIALDGGGRGVDARGADILARAYRAPSDGDVRFGVIMAGEARTLDVAASDLARTLREVIEAALVVARRDGFVGTPWRMRSLADVYDRLTEGLAYVARPNANERRDGCEVATHDRSYGGPSHGERPDIDLRTGIAPLGIYASASARRIALVPSVPLARLSASAARDVARVAREHVATIRLASWRGFVLDIPASASADATNVLIAEGLPLDARDGFAGIAACAGRGACDAARADVRIDAAAYASSIAKRMSSAETSATVNFAGCEKRCAMRHDVDAECVATAAGYDVRVRGALLGTGLDAASAIALVARAGAAR